MGRSQDRRVKFTFGPGQCRH